MSIEDQPPPIAQPERVPVWDLVVADVRRQYGEIGEPHRQAVDLSLADMAERDRVGRERYGVPLTTHNGRDHLVDAYQEALDQLVYLRAEIEENGGKSWGRSVMNAYAVAMGNALGLRGIIMLRDQPR